MIFFLALFLREMESNTHYLGKRHEYVLKFNEIIPNVSALILLEFLLLEAIIMVSNCEVFEA